MKTLVQQNAGQEGFWLRAEKQSGGIGRLGRKWESPEGNLYCSTIVQVRHNDPQPSSLSFVTSLAVYYSIRTCLPDADLMLKWPNDVLLYQSKVCGILLEQVGITVIVGIGVNIAIAPCVEGRAATSLHEVGLNKSLNASDFLELLVNNFAVRLEKWRSLGLQSTLRDWEKLAHPIGTKLSASIAKDNRIQGNFAGLTQNGGLRLKKPDGSLVEIHAGDVDAS